MQSCSRALPRVTTGSLTVLIFLAAMLTAGSKPAFAGSNDRVSFAQRIVVHQDESVSDVVCFLCTIENHGTIDGDVVSFLGGVKTEGPVHGDLVSFLGDVSLAGEGSIDGDLVVMGGNLHKSADTRLGASQVIFSPAIFLLPFILLGIVVLGVTRIFRRRPVYFAPLR